MCLQEWKLPGQIIQVPRVCACSVTSLETGKPVMACVYLFTKERPVATMEVSMSGVWVTHRSISRADLTVPHSG